MVTFGYFCVGIHRLNSRRWIVWLKLWRLTFWWRIQITLQRACHLTLLLIVYGLLHLLLHQHCIKKCHIFARYVLAIQKCLQINFFLSQACNSSISFPCFSRYGAQVYRCPGQFPLPFKRFNVVQASLLLYLLPIMTLTYSFRILGFKSSLPEAVKVLSK